MRWRGARPGPARSTGLPIATTPAGSWRAAGSRNMQLIRPQTTPQAAFTKQLTVPIGNDGVAFPVTFGSGGAATAFCGPSGAGTTWSPSQAAVYTSVGLLDAALCALYVGPAAIAQYQVAAGLAGGGSQFALGGVTMQAGWLVWAIWTGGTPGETGYLNVTGSKTALATS
jgi:hypothetical protein